MISIKSTWWHRLVRVLQLGIVISLIAVMLNSGSSAVEDSALSERVWYVSGDDEYSRTLESKVFDCADYWGDEASLPSKIIWECDRVSTIFLADQVLVDGFFPFNFDKTDLTLVHSVLASVSDCNESRCFAFKGSAAPPPSASAFERFDYNRTEFPRWFSELDLDQKGFLIDFNLVTAKYEDVQMVKQSDVTWGHVLFVTLLFGLLAFILTEVFYRIILYIVFGKSSLRLKLE